MKPARLDVLIYGHDGRGLGHASRSIGIGLALRRLHPKLRVLFVSGCSFSQEMIGGAALDWLKLPSYKTEVIGGKSRGVDGNSMYSDEQLGYLRREQLAACIKLYRPRLVLVDHTPQGKHRELTTALAESRRGGRYKTRWVLGVRGVVGEVAQAKSEAASALFQKYYDELLWYGDSNVLGEEHCRQLEKQYGKRPVECGYVLRMAEFVRSNMAKGAHEKQYAGTISIPWLGEHGGYFLYCLARALKNIDPTLGRWRLFIPLNEDIGQHKTIELLQSLSHCSVESPSKNYVPSLLQSKSAMVYGGYNSLMDVLYAGIPSIVVLREMQDAEQQIHVQSLRKVLGDTLSIVSESEVTATELQSLLMKNLRAEIPSKGLVQLGGADRAANHLHSLLLQSEDT